MFSSNPMTEADAQKAREFPLLPDGIYDFAVLEAKFKHSKTGNAMIELKIQINHEGEQFNIFDNLIAATMMEWKTRHFCEATGLLREYETAKFNENLCPGRRGTCAITTQAARPKNDGTTAMWKAKNEVSDYISADKLSGKANPFAPPAAKLPTAPGAEPFLNDEIPF